MKQYGDITKLDGAKLEPVDLIVGGSPCQDLSIAGQRKGLEGERSGLFMEMIRVIKEMRNATNFIRPRWILWENVPGAFSSNDGLDFQAVLTELCRIAEPGTPDVPMPEEGWTKAGVLLGPDWSIAWRTHDAQFWGVPQRRRRIALVMDLRGQSAPEILFERKGVSGNHEQSEAQREGITGEIGESTENADISFQERSREGVLIQKDRTGALRKTFHCQYVHRSTEPQMIEMTSTKNTIVDNGISPTLTARMGTGGNQVNAVFDESKKQKCVASMQGFGDYVETDIASSCKQRDYKDATDQVCRIQEDQPYVRKLTPVEVERLQGLPDNWTLIPGATDNKRFRALGNSIALPFGLSLPSGLSALVR